MAKKRTNNAIKEHARLMKSYSESKRLHFFNCLDKRGLEYVSSLPAWALCDDDYPIENFDGDIVAWKRVNYNQKRPNGAYVEYDV